MADGKIGEFPATIDYHLVDGKLQAVTVQVYHVLFDDVLKAFVERYGQPTTAQDGAVWQGKNSLVLLWKKFPDIFASIQSRSYQDFTLSRQKEKAKSAAKRPLTNHNAQRSACLFFNHSNPSLIRSRFPPIRQTH